MPSAVVLLYSMAIRFRIMIGCYLIFLLVIKKYYADIMLLKLRVSCGLKEAYLLIYLLTYLTYLLTYLHTYLLTYLTYLLTYLLYLLTYLITYLLT
jgi:hypothetical protein